MSAIVIASFNRSPKNTKCLLLATSQRWDCQSAKIKHIKVCVQNILRMLECMFDDVNACLIAYWWSSGWNVATLPSDATLAGRRRHESGFGTHALAASPRSSSLPGWCQHCWLARDWSDEVWCFTGKAIVCGEYHVYGLGLLHVSERHSRTSDRTN